MHKYLVNCLCTAWLLLASNLVMHAQLLSGEYFFDNDPGQGAGVSFDFADDDSVAISLSVPINSLSPGFHNLYTRVRDNMGVWSMFEGRTFYVIDPIVLNSSQPHLVAGEYFFDQDPGVGSGVGFSFTNTDSVSHTLAIPVSSLSPGFHNLFVRVKNSNGIWSMFEGRTFYVIDPSVLNASQPQLVSGEFFFDNDPGNGNGTSFSFSAADSVSHVINIPSNALSPGFHNLFVRVKNAYGVWSLFEGRTFYVIDPSALNASQPLLVSGEYFFDNDPGNGNGTAFSFSAADSVSHVINIPSNALSPGFHNLFVRVKNASGIWSMFEGRTFYVIDPSSINTIQPQLVSGEYFFDSDPGIGNGTAFSFTATDSLSMIINPNVTGLSLGSHRFFVRVRNADGKWSLFEGRPFNVCNDVLDTPQTSGHTVYCTGQTITQVGTGVTGATSYLWRGPSGFTQAGLNLSRSNATIGMAGTYNLYAIRPGGAPCDSSLTTVNIVVNPQVISHPQSVCFPLTVDITAEWVVSGDMTDAAISYWQDPAATLVLNNAAALNTSGTYYAMVEWPSGCSKIIPVVVDIMNCGAVILQQPPSSTIGCTSGGTTIAVSAMGVDSHQWQISTNNGGSWSNLNNAGNYSGTTTGILSISNPAIGFSGYQYRVVLHGGAGSVTSAVSILTVQVCPANDSPLPSNPNMNAVAHYYPNLVFVQGSTTGATISAQTGTADVWYQFNAISSGVRIVVNSSVIDPVIRLCNASYEVLDTENVVEGTGEERLNYGGLTPGQNYFIAISSANSNQGTFNLAVQKLRAPGCGTVAPYSLCTSFKSTYTGATTTQFTFTQGETTTSHTAAGPFSLGVTGLQLLHGNTYSVGLTANFELNDGNNENETIEVATVNACTVSIASQPSIEVRSNQRCANGATLLRHTYLQAVPVGVSLVCGITGYQVEFTPVDNCQGDNPNPLDKITRTINGSNTSISLNNVFNGLPLSNHPHIGYWSVVYTPVFHGSILGNPSTTARVIAVNGTSTNAALSAEQSDVFNVVAGVNPIVANLYPNPNTGDMVNLNMTGITTDHVHVRIMDSMGRVVYSHRYTVDGTLNTIASFSRPLSNGIYMVEFTSGNEIITQRMMVSK